MADINNSKVTFWDNKLFTLNKPTEGEEGENNSNIAFAVNDGSDGTRITINDWSQNTDGTSKYGVYFNKNEETAIPHIIHDGVVFTAGSYTKESNSNKIEKISDTNKIINLVHSLSSNPFNKEITFNTTELDFSDLLERISILETTLDSFLNTRTFGINPTLINATSEGLSNPKALTSKGNPNSPYIVIPSPGYRLGTDADAANVIKVENADYTWVSITSEPKNFSLTLTNLTDEVNISINAIENLPTHISINDVNSNQPITESQTITGSNGSIKFKVGVNYINNNIPGLSLLTDNTKFKFKDIPSDIKITYKGTNNKTTEVKESHTFKASDNKEFTIIASYLPNDTVYAYISTALEKEGYTNIQYSIPIDVTQGSVTGISSISPSTSTQFDNTSNSEIDLTAILEHNIIPSSIDEDNVPTTEFTWTLTGNEDNRFEIVSDNTNSNTIKIKHIPHESQERKEVTVTVKYGTSNDDKFKQTVTLVSKEYIPTVNYYWYVGQTNPASIDTSNLKTATNEAGWHLIGTSIDGFTLTINSQNRIKFEEKKQYYLVIPDGLTLYASDGVTIHATLLEMKSNIPNHKTYISKGETSVAQGFIVK